jgi:pyrroline-5-carboxylate reductase
MFPILEAMSDGAVKVGIPRDVSLRLAAQTMKGAAELLLQEISHPAVLKDSVCSPGMSIYAKFIQFQMQYKPC